MRQICRKPLILRILCGTIDVHDSIKVRLEEWVTAHSFNFVWGKTRRTAEAERNLTTQKGNRMAKKKITELIEELTTDFLAENGLELYNSEFVKEGKDWFLRVYIDKLPAEQTASKAAEDGNADGAPEQEAAEATGGDCKSADTETAAKMQYVSTDDCEKVSRFLSAELDRIDPIEQNYYLEVSSPGMDRVLLREKDFKRFAGEQVDISLYKAASGRKTYEGKLVGLVDGQIVIIQENGTEIAFPKEQVAKTKLAVIF